MIEASPPETERLGRLQITVPADDEYVRVVRMVVGSGASIAGMGDEEIADLKVAVSEACTNAVLHAYSLTDDHSRRTIEVAIDLWDGFIEVDVSDRGGGVRRQDVKPGPGLETEEGGFGLYLIGSLMDKVEIVGDQSQGTRLRFSKRRL